MPSQIHRPFYRGTSCVCADCGVFLYDVRTAARLRSLSDVDEVKCAAVERRFTSDPKLAKRLVEEDPREVVSTYKFADKLNDFLENPKARPDLQTPEAKAFLDQLRIDHHNGKTDALFPWLVREWKKGRVKLNKGPQYNDIRFEAGPDYEHDGGRFHRLNQGELEHWADWYNSDHPSRRGKDIMQMKAPELHQTIKDWDQDMREKAKSEAQIRGNVVHSYPDGWTMQQLTDAKQLKDEGDSMGHCVGSYAGPVERGNTLIYSLRDHQNEPHVTMEISPKWYEGDDPNEQKYAEPYTWTDELRARKERGELKPIPHQGQVVQIQGKGNERPVPTYQRRVKDFFETIPEEERPTWGDRDPVEYAEDFIDNDEPGEEVYGYHKGDYGLNQPELSYDWDNILNSSLDNEFHNYVSPDDFFKRADAVGKGPELHAAAKRWVGDKSREAKEQLEDEWQKIEDDPDFEWNFRQYEPHPEIDLEDDEEFQALSPKEQEERQEEWYKRYYEYCEDEKADWMSGRNGWSGPQTNIDELNYYDEWETALARRELQQRREEEDPQQRLPGSVPPTVAHIARVRRPHPHFSTGEPCYCTFAKHIEPTWHEATALVCEVCGDPLEHGKCKRCDWGQWSNAMGPGDLNPQDPTKEMHPGIQA